MNPINTFSILNDLVKLSAEADEVISKAYPPVDNWFTEFKELVHSTWNSVCTHTGKSETVEIPKFPEISKYVGTISPVQNLCTTERNKSKSTFHSPVHRVHDNQAAYNGTSSILQPENCTIKRSCKRKVNVVPVNQLQVPPMHNAQILFRCQVLSTQDNPTIESKQSQSSYLQPKESIVTRTSKRKAKVGVSQQELMPSTCDNPTVESKQPQYSLRSAKKGTPAEGLQIPSAKQEKSNAKHLSIKSVMCKAGSSRKGVEAAENEKRFCNDPKSSYEQKIINKKSVNTRKALEEESKTGNSSFKRKLEADSSNSNKKVKASEKMESIASIQKTKEVIDLSKAINQKLTTFLPLKDSNATKHSFLSNTPMLLRMHLQDNEKEFQKLATVKKPDKSEDVRRKLSLRRQQKVQEQKRKREEKFQKTKSTRLKLEKEREERVLKLHKGKEQVAKLADKKPRERERKKTSTDDCANVNTMVSTPVIKSATKVVRAPRQLNTVFKEPVNAVMKKNKNQETVQTALISISQNDLNSTYVLPDNQEPHRSEKPQGSTVKDKLAAPNNKQLIKNFKKTEAATPPKINATFAQQKPNSYEMTPPPPPVFSYDISDLRSDDDDDSDSETASKKPIPEWATGIMLKNMIFQQHYHNEDDRVFGTEIDMPNLEEIFGHPKNKKGYVQRSSSAVWNTPERPI